jgi:putative colanic acid biosynthesis UDP-glucose lipid carrier transferase
LVALLDCLAIGLGAWIAYQIRFSPAAGGSWAVFRPEDRLLVMTISLFSSLFFIRVYRMWPGGALAAMVGRVTVGWLLCWVIAMVMLVLTKTGELFSRTWLVTWLLVTVGSLWLGRLIAFLIMAQMRRAGYQHKKVLLVGATELMTTIRNRVGSATWSGYDIVASVESTNEQELERLDALLKPDEVWIGVRMSDHEQLGALMYALRQSVANVRLLPDLQMYQILSHSMTETLGIPMVDISVSPMFGGHLVAKVLLDYIAATLILVLLTPLLLVLAVAVKCSSKGPILFQQKRHGWNGEEIWVYKFRSMVVHQELDDSVTQAKREDPRVTPIGRFLRETSLDELPQFINVLQGRMSVVGPRPHALAHNNEYIKQIANYALRHKVKPGITGWAQICGYRGETDTLDKMEGRIKHDLYYLEHWSLWIDIKIILLTPMAIIQKKNAY